MGRPRPAPSSWPAKRDDEPDRERGESFPTRGTTLPDTRLRPSPNSIRRPGPPTSWDCENFGKTPRAGPNGSGPRDRRVAATKPAIASPEPKAPYPRFGEQPPLRFPPPVRGDPLRRGKRSTSGSKARLGFWCLPTPGSAAARPRLSRHVASLQSDPTVYPDNRRTFGGELSWMPLFPLALSDRKESRWRVSNPSTRGSETVPKDAKHEAMVDRRPQVSSESRADRLEPFADSLCSTALDEITAWVTIATRTSPPRLSLILRRKAVVTLRIAFSRQSVNAAGIGPATPKGPLRLHHLDEECHVEIANEIIKHRPEHQAVIVVNFRGPRWPFFTNRFPSSNSVKSGARFDSLFTAELRNV